MNSQTKEERRAELMWYKENRDLIVKNLKKWQKKIKELDDKREMFLRTGDMNGRIVPFMDRKHLAPAVEFIQSGLVRQKYEKYIQRLQSDLWSIDLLDNREDKSVDIDAIKRISIEHVLQRYHVEKNRMGFITSPYHDEKTPSCKIYVNKNSYYDFSSKQGGSVIDLVMALENCEFKEALKILSTI